MPRRNNKNVEIENEQITPNGSDSFSDKKNKKKENVPASDQMNFFDNISNENIIVVNNETSPTLPQETQGALKTNDKLKLANNSKPLKSQQKKVETHKKADKKFNIFNLNREPKTMIEIPSDPVEETEKLNEAEEAVKKQSSKKQKILSLVFMLINLGIVAGLLVYNLLSDTTSLSGILSINWWIFLLAVVLTSLNMLTEAAKIWLLTWKTTGKSRPFLGYKVAALGRHYDSITPLSVGGEPFQVYYMNKNGIPAAKAVSIPVGNYIIFQISYVILSLVVMISSIFLSSNTSNVGSTIVSASSWIGFSLNFLLVVVVLLVSINKKIGNGLISGILKLLKKMHLIKAKNYDNVYTKATNTINDYQQTIANYAKNKSTFFLMMFLSFAGMILKFIMPYIIYCVFNGFGTSVNFIDIFIKTVMIELASNFIPLPGGTLAAELSFTVFFSSLMGSDIFWAMLIWRILTYYINMVRGIIIIVYDYAVGNKKREWLAKKWKLEEESKKFEAEQLKDFELTLVKQNKKKQKENLRRVR